MFDVIVWTVTVSAAVLLWRSISVLRQDIVKENDRLRAALAPLIRHASAHEYAPPISFSVGDCKKIREKING